MRKLEKMYSDISEENRNLRNNNSARDKQISELKQEISDKNSEIETLRKRLDEITDKVLAVEEVKEKSDIVFGVLADEKNIGLTKKIGNLFKK